MEWQLGFLTFSKINKFQVNDAMDMNMENVDDQAEDIYNGILGEIGLEY